MKFIIVSDLHMRWTLWPWYKQMPEADVFIDCGDISFGGRQDELIKYNKWVGTLPYKYKILSPGNHDRMFEKNTGLAKKLVSNCKVVCHDLIEIEGIKIFCSPYQPRFYDWAFNVDRGVEIKKKWDQIPEGIDILVTHGPPEDILDLNLDMEHCGCEELRKAVDRIKPKFHCFGHIHKCHGISEVNGTTFINASICNEQYNPVNKYITFDI